MQGAHRHSFGTMLLFPLQDKNNFRFKNRIHVLNFREREYEKGCACISRILEAWTTEVNKSEDQGHKPFSCSYLCAFPSPFCRTSMISRTICAGSRGLSRYNSTFLPYLSFNMLGKELIISCKIIETKNEPVCLKDVWNLNGKERYTLNYFPQHT